MKDQRDPSPDNAKAEEQFNELLRYLKRTRGTELSGYKRPSLMRRIARRMDTVRIAGFDRYIDYLEVHPEEFNQLFNYLLINVTAFFRDPSAWEFLKASVLPKIIEGKQPQDMIRVWSAGCASGEEPYTVAMLLCELLGMEAFQKRVKIYASDIDQEALDQARQASFSMKAVATIPPRLLQTYFDRMGEHYMFHADVRRALIFGRHDLLTDAPISRLDLLVCRNVLMYFNAEMQDHILARFHFALNDTGYLFLGKAEMLLTHTDLFTPVDLRHRVFSKATNLGLRERLRVLHHIGEEDGAIQLTQQIRMREMSFNVAPFPQLVVDVEGNLILANDQARSIFDIRPGNLGHPFRDLEVSYRPAELRTPLEQAFSARRSVQVPNVRWHTGEGTPLLYEVEIIPLMEDGANVMGACLIFRDVSQTMSLQDELQHTKQELETAYEELQSTNEELETTNEELQSTVEELETTNEELQSTNEELETMNEELQSTNEELQTVNTELRDRTDDLQQANLLQESILAALESGVVVLDESQTVKLWNHQSENLCGLRADEVKGKSFLNLDIGLPVADLARAIQASSSNGTTQTTVVNAVNRRGKQIACRVMCAPLRDSGLIMHGAILFMEEEKEKKPGDSAAQSDPK